jgi:hypothetical protein
MRRRIPDVPEACLAAFDAGKVRIRTGTRFLTSIQGEPSMARPADDTTLFDNEGEIRTIADRDLCLRYLRHGRGLPEGEYTVRGPGIDLRLHNVGSVMYPAGGMIDGNAFPDRTRRECIETFRGDDRFSAN